MKCPFCSGTDNRVIDKRDSDAMGGTRRRRECLNCHQRFTTYERIELVELTVVKKDDSREAFNPEKLRAGVMRACEKRPVRRDQIDQIIEDVGTRLRAEKTREVSSSLIGEFTLELLKNLDQVAYIRFASVYRSFADIETFQREIQELQG